VLLSSPRTEQERTENAGLCVRKLGVRIPALIDGIADRAEYEYTGWPDRRYVIQAGGRVAYKSPPGPFGFAPKKMEAQLQQAIAR